MTHLAQTQISAKNIATCGHISHDRGHFAGHTDKRGAGIMIIVRIKAGFIKQANQVNIRRIIQLARAHFAHCQRDHTARVGNIIRAHSRQLPAAYFRRNQCLDRHIHRQIAKIRQRLCDFSQPPNTAQISQTCDQRNPALAARNANGRSSNATSGKLTNNWSTARHLDHPAWGSNQAASFCIKLDKYGLDPPAPAISLVSAGSSPSRAATASAPDQYRDRLSAGQSFGKGHVYIVIGRHGLVNGAQPAKITNSHQKGHNMSRSLNRVNGRTDRRRPWGQSRSKMPSDTRTAQQAADAAGCDLDQIAKSIIFAGADSGKLYLLHNQRVAIRLIQAQASNLAGEPLGRADAHMVRATTGFAIGGVSPVGHVTPIRAFIDPRLHDFSLIYAAAGTPRHIFAIDTAELSK